MRQTYDYWQNQPDCSRTSGLTRRHRGGVVCAQTCKRNLTPDRSGARPSRPRTSKCARSLHGGVSFFRLISPRDGLHCVCMFTICRCALEADRRGRRCVCETCRRQGHIRLWPDCSSRIGYATRHKVCHASKSKSHPPPESRKGGGQSVNAFGREGLSSWHRTMHSLLASGMRTPHS